LKNSRNRDYTVEIIVNLGKPTPYCVRYNLELDESVMQPHKCLEKKCPHLTYVKRVHRFA